MDHFTHCPAPDKGGRDCWREPHPASRFGLCVEHWRGIVQDWLADTPQTTRRCPTCQILNRYDTADFAAATCQNCGEDVSARWLIELDEKRQAELRRLEPVQHVPAQGVVYYISFRDAVKIGFSTDLAQRVKVHPSDTVLAAEPGGYALERERHAQFSALLLDGHREWFQASEELIEHAKRIRETFGDPFEVSLRVFGNVVPA